VLDVPGTPGVSRLRPGRRGHHRNLGRDHGAGTSGDAGRATISQGVLLYPQVPDSASESLNFAKETCTLTTQDFCPVILSDFEVREFPVEPTAVTNG